MGGGCTGSWNPEKFRQWGQQVPGFFGALERQATSEVLSHQQDQVKDQNMSPEQLPILQCGDILIGGNPKVLRGEGGGAWMDTAKPIHSSHQDLFVNAEG